MHDIEFFIIYHACNSVIQVTAGEWFKFVVNCKNPFTLEVLEKNDGSMIRVVCHIGKEN